MSPNASNPGQSTDRRRFGPLWWIALAMFLVAAALSLQLSLHHAARISIPGCGSGSPCARAAASRWASVPGLGWPVSYVGTAFFAGLAAAWIAAGGGVSVAVRMLVRVGVAASIFFLVIAIGERLWCAYCIAAHVANLVGWAATERLAPERPSPRARAGLVAFAASALLAGASIAVIDASYGKAAAADAERRLAESESRLKESRLKADLPRALTGRYPWGPPNAPVRIVLYTDYQCPDCRSLDERIEALLQERSDVSVSVRHFPFCTRCNPRAGRDLHPNACNAARAAEAAGLLGGSEGFWRVHRWLFARGGEFTSADLARALPALGFDAPAFDAQMTSERTLAPIESDIEEAFRAGLGSTPMIFINGIELRGWNAPDALRRAADAAAGTPNSAATNDVPAGALEKLVADWKAQPLSHIPPGPRPRVRGPADAHVRIVLFGDYQEPNCAQADATIRRIVSERPGVSYQFRHFPLNPGCNPIARVVPHPLACRMAAAAEAAGDAGGDAAFWAAHEWLFANQKKFTDHGFLGALRPLGVEIQSLAAASSTPEIGGRILADCRAAEAVGVQEIPLIFVNERAVPRWTYEGLPVLESIIEVAARPE